VALVFHKVVSIEEALEILEEKLGGLKPIGVEYVSIDEAYGRILAEDVYAVVDSPPFDRSTVDGYAVIAEDTYIADEANPVKLKLAGTVKIGAVSEIEVKNGTCVEVSTGACIPRGANAVVMVEYTKREDEHVLIYKAVAPGENIAQTGSDAAIGDLVIKKGRKIGFRELAALAAVGVNKVKVYSKPSVAVFSIGDELADLSQHLPPGKIYDVNRYSIISMLKALGLNPDFIKILPDDYDTIEREISEILEKYNIIITSGSTSAGFGDVVYRVFAKLGEVLVHGLRVKPGKPTVIAVGKDGKLFIGLPGFPLSTMMIFQVLVKPIILKIMGCEELVEDTVKARLGFRIDTGKGKRHLIPVHIVPSKTGLIAYPVISDSGAATTLSLVDGFIDIEEERQYVEEDEQVEVKLFEKIKFPELTIIGSNCPALELLLNQADIRNFKIINVGSLAGWRALKRGEADVTGTHLLDPETMTYNLHIPKKLGLEKEVELYRGYIRTIGLIVEKGNPKKISSLEDLLRDDVVFVNRVKGSGIRTYIDTMLSKMGVTEPEKKIRGYTYEVKTHNAVAVAIAQKRADVGVALGYVAKIYGLDFIPLTEEIFDIAVRKDRLEKESVKKILNTFNSQTFKEKLRELPFYRPHPEMGKKIFG